MAGIFLWAGCFGLQAQAQQGAIKWSGYQAPQILEPLYSGQFEHIADDTSTRNYVLSLVKGMGDECPSLASRNKLSGPSITSYALYKEQKETKQAIDAANSGNYDESLNALLEAGHGGLGHAGGVAAVQAHLQQRGLNDARRLIATFGCSGRASETVADNIVKLARARDSIPPSDDPQAILAKKANAQGRALGQPLANACGVAIKGVGVSDRTKAEGWCRCMESAVLNSQLADDDIQGLIKADFSQKVLFGLKKQYPLFFKNTQGCYD